MYTKEEAKMEFDRNHTPSNGKVISSAIWGASNAGKSSIFNKLVGWVISAISNKAFTTDEAITGISTDLNKNV